MARKCVRKFRGKGGVMRCAKFAGGGKGRRRRKAGRRRKSRRGLSGDVARCVNYAKTKNGLWRCLMQVRGPGNPSNRPVAKKYRYSTTKARKRRLRGSKLNFRTQTGRGAVTRRRRKRA